MVAGAPEVRQFPGGASNLTYLLRYPAGELILRRPPVGAKARGAHDMGREHRIQSALRPVFPLVPAMVAFCDDDAVLGSDFYVMERVEGTIVRRELPWPLPPEQVSALCGRAWDVLRQLHAVDVAALPDLAALGRGDGLRRPAGRRLDGPAVAGGHRRPRRLGAGHRLAGRAAAPRRRAVPDPQRLPPRQRGARAGATVGAAGASSRCSTGRWPPSATR